MELAGKVALITGAGAEGGIGARIAALFAREGAEVIVSGRDAERAAPVLRALEDGGGKARFVAADLSVVDDVRRLAAEAGEVDVLVNNATLFTVSPSVDVDPDVIDASFATNVRAPFLLTTLLAPGMAARGGGSIVNISSAGATKGAPGLAVYTSTKAALEQLTRTFAAEFRGVRVNAVAFGPTRSDKVMGVMGERMEELGAELPLGRMLTPEEVAEAVLWVASDRASALTGAVVAADGGRGAV